MGETVDEALVAPADAADDLPVGEAVDEALVALAEAADDLPVDAAADDLPVAAVEAALDIFEMLEDPLRLLSGTVMLAGNPSPLIPSFPTQFWAIWARVPTLSVKP